MKWNLDNTQNKSFEKGKRYDLVIVDAKEGFSSQKSTPYLKLTFETTALDKAFDKTLYNTEKAAFRMIEWAKAMGFPSEGNVDLDPEKMRGIRLSAKCDYRKADDGKEYIDWVEPLPMELSGAPAAAQPPATQLAEAASSDEVPF